MRACEPVDHLVAHEKAELLLKLELRFGKATGNGHDGTTVDTLCGERSHECLQVRRETEGDGLGVMEEGFPGCHTRHQFGAPDVSGASSDVELVWVSIVHVQDIRHEGERGELVRELSSEQPKFGERRIRLCEVLQGQSVRNPFLSNGIECLQSRAHRMLGVLLGINISSKCEVFGTGLLPLPLPKPSSCPS